MTNEDKRGRLQKTWTRWRGMEGERKKEGKAEKVERKKKKCGRMNEERKKLSPGKAIQNSPQKTRKDTLLPARREEREGTFALPGTPVSGRRCRVGGEQGTAAASKQRWKPFRFRAKLCLIYSPVSM